MKTRGIVIARKKGIGIEIIALYNIIFTDGSKTKYWTAGLGLTL